MDYCHQHNLVDPDNANADKKFGIKVSLPPGDTFSKIIGNDWECVHWYATEIERDKAIDDMARRHEYSRTTDLPTQVLKKIFR
jgi:hypothetical protein